MSCELSRPESVQTTPVSIGATSSAFSDIESVVSLGDHIERSDFDTNPQNPTPVPVHPEFAFPDGNVEIRTTDQAFWVHEYHLNKFSVFATLIQAAKDSDSEALSKSGSRVVIACEQKAKRVDVYNTLRVIYASHIDGVPDFDASIMTSALRIASTFNYPGLRKFAISKLEGMKLPASQRIQLSDEFLLPAWEMLAFTELCSRAEPISHAEAEALGTTRFVEVARIRETQRTRWAVELINGINDDLCQVSANSLTTGSSASNGTSAQDDLEYSSGRSQLPRCDCDIEYLGGNPGSIGYKGIEFRHCRIHNVAPQVLAEGQTLLKQRDELRTRLENVQSVVKRKLERRDFPLDSGALDVKTELAKASWIRRECTVVS